MTQIIKFDLSKDDYLKKSRQLFEDGDIAKSISTLKAGQAKYGRFYEASIALAEIYASIDYLDKANEILFLALNETENENEHDEIFYQLAMNFWDMGEFEVAEYYLRDIADKFDLQIPETIDFEDGTKKKFQVVYPHGEGYYQMLVERAYRLIREGRFDDAILTLDKVDKRSQSKKTADHVALIAMMMKNDIDSVIVNARRIINEDSGNLSAKCTLATALLMEEKTEEAFLVLDEVLACEYDNIEDIMLVLHLLVNVEMHAEIVKYTKKLISKSYIQPDILIWLSQALYNLGQKDEAEKVMRKVDIIYGTCTAAAYYLNLYKSGVGHVSYVLGLPYEQRIGMRKQIESVLKTKDEDVADELDGSVDDDNSVKRLFDWAYVNEDNEIKIALFDKIVAFSTPWIEKFVQRQLVSTDLTFSLMTRLMCHYVHDGLKSANFDVVAQSRFKRIRIVFPKAFGLMPHIFEAAYVFACADIVFADEDQNDYLYRLTLLVNHLVHVDDAGNVSFAHCDANAIARLKSMQTLSCVLLCQVYKDDEEMVAMLMDKYEVKQKTYDKYCSLLFGENDL